MIEEWRTVVGWEGLYEVSSLARVRSLTRMIPTCGKLHNYTKRATEGRLLKANCNPSGYFVVDLREGKRRKNALVHRLFAIAFIPNPENKPHINHIDGNKLNNSMSNLEWCTHQENMSHAFRTGLSPRKKLGKGEESISAKLNDLQVIEIKKRLAAGEKVGTIAKDYPVKSASTIAHIRDGNTWAHINI